MTDKPTYSFSGLSLYVKCGESYYIKKIQQPRPPERPAAWLVHGNAFHEAVPEWFETGQSRPLFEIYQEKWDLELDKQNEKQPDRAMWNLTPRVKSVDTDLSLRLEAGLGQCDAFERHYESAPWEVAELSDDTLALEIDFQIEFDSCFVRGYIDMVKVWPDGSFTVCDLKTGSPQEDYRQLSLYALALQEVYGLDVTLGEFWYTKLDGVPKSGDKAGRSSGLRAVGREGFGREYWNKQFGMLESGIRNEIFLPNPSANCAMFDGDDACNLP